MSGRLARDGPLYHVHAQVVSRASGASAVAGAAYRSRGALTDERTGEAHDYRNRRDDLDGAEILTPRDAPAWAQDPRPLMERGRSGRAPEGCAGRPRGARGDPARAQRGRPPRARARLRAARPLWIRGMVADIAFHGGQGENPHAHIMLTTRTPHSGGLRERRIGSGTRKSTW